MIDELLDFVGVTGLKVIVIVLILGVALLAGSGLGLLWRLARFAWGGAW